MVDESHLHPKVTIVNINGHKLERVDLVGKLFEDRRNDLARSAPAIGDISEKKAHAGYQNELKMCDRRAVVVRSRGVCVCVCVAYVG